MTEEKIPDTANLAERASAKAESGSSLTAMFLTFGCKLNFAETATIQDMLKDRGILKAAPGQKPDIIIVNTCSVTELADKKCRQTIRMYHRRYPDAAIVATGCYAQLKPDEVASLPGVVIVAGNDRKLRLADYIESWIESKSRFTGITTAKDIREFSPSCSRGDRTRYFLKVQDGCDYFCSYCTIPFARGRSRSATIDSVIRQAEAVAADGGKEIVITGVNIGDFGHGRDDTFFDLIRQLDGVDGIERYRISSIEPNLLTPDMIWWVAQSRAFMPHFHIPLQCGSDAVLKLMRRRYGTELFRSRIDEIRRAMPHAFIGVDLIVGARGETAEEFQRSRSFVESLPISRLHVFPYSERPGTRALTEIGHVVSQEDKHSRSHAMIEVSDSKLKTFLRSFDAMVRPVLVEHTGTDGYLEGFTDNYIRVAIPQTACEPNTIVNVKLRYCGGEKMMGEPAI